MATTPAVSGEHIEAELVLTRDDALDVAREVRWPHVARARKHPRCAATWDLPRSRRFRHRRRAPPVVGPMMKQRAPIRRATRHLEKEVHVDSVMIERPPDQVVARAVGIRRSRRSSTTGCPQSRSTCAGVRTARVDHHRGCCRCANVARIERHQSPHRMRGLRSRRRDVDRSASVAMPRGAS